MLYNNVKVILEYTKVLFNKDTFFTTLKRKYQDYDNDYTKYTRPFLDMLILSAQYRQIKPKDFIKLFYQVLANLKVRKLFNNIK